MTGPRPQDVEIVCKGVLDVATIAKREVMVHLESGDRDWVQLRATLEHYIQYQTAADVLSGQTKMEQGR
jgi:hypothetical protein